MRFKMYFELEKANISIQYRKFLISFIKNAINKYDENLFKEIYKDNNKKTFAFATILPEPYFKCDNIELKSNKFSVIFTIYNYVYALHIYNSILKQKFQKFSLHQNSMTLKNIVMIKEQDIDCDFINIKMISPIICRNHDRVTLKDMYYAYNRKEFEKYIKINILEQMKHENLNEDLIENFKIEPIKGKKIVVKLYEKQIECSIGTFRLEGNTELLRYLYKSGIGAKKAMGFGVFDIV